MNIGIVIGLIKALAPGVDPEVIEQAVSDWMDDHPEATTTVQDGSITEAKLAQDVLADLAEIETLSEAIAPLPGMDDSTKTGVDLDVSDEDGNVLLRMKDGHVQTKYFDSKLIRNLTGKKWACIGDSITAVNEKTTKHYHDYIAEETGVTVVNLGYSGAGFAREGGLGKDFTDVAEMLTSDVDVVTIMASGNDMSSGINLGDPTDTGTTTICGCINTTIDEVYSILPTKGFGIITSVPWETKEPSDGETNMSLYNEAVVQICALRGIPCLDLFHCSLLHPDDSSFRSLAYSKDGGSGVHPDETGHAMIAPRIRQFLFTLI